MRTSPVDEPHAQTATSASSSSRCATTRMNESRVLIRSASSTARPRWAALALALAAGCTGGMGPAGIGTLGAGNETPAVMRLQPDVSATVCQRWILGIPLGPDDAGDPVAPLVAELLSRDAEATLLNEADIRWEH